MASVEDLQSGSSAPPSDSRGDMVAIENSSPEVIHVVNVSSASQGGVPQVVTLAGLPGSGNPHSIQTLTLAAANQLGFALPGTPLVGVLMWACAIT